MANAQVSQRAATLITRSVNENERVVLRGNVHPAVRTAIDQGEAASDLPLEHLLLQLKRSPAADAELASYLEELHNPRSPSFHRWGTAADFSRRFGLAASDIETVRNWLQSQGFKVNTIYPNLAIDFSGTAGQVRAAFHAPLHNVEVNGAHHIANMQDPEIPAALADAVAGPVSLNDFKPHPASKPRPQYTIDANYQLVVPLDLQTIYNLNPLYGAGVSGQGQTVVLLERTDLYSNGDWSAFRKTLGLSRKFPLGSFKVMHPAPGSGGACADPGVVVGDDGEATLDVEWASASAPNASIVLASCADSTTNFGAFIALQNLLSGSSLPPAVMSLSYGAPESEQGADGNAYVNALYQLAVFEGVTLFVSSDDAGAAGTDQNRSAATHGINVNSLASTGYNVAVGGTDFGDSFLGEQGSYWSATNGPSYNSALSYIPEIPWNDSCASQLITLALGYAAPFGADGSCNSAIGEEYFLSTGAGGGGPSACASGAPTIFGVVNGTCQGYPKPSFQKGLFGNPSDGVRDLPDVSLFAANGVWGHYYVFCYTNPAGGGTPCNTPPSGWAGAGGTSFASPIMAGVQALINQSTGARQGNANYVYYQLAAAEYGSSGSSGCNSTLGNGTASGCVFHDVTLGDMDVNCKSLATSSGQVVGTFSCYYPKNNPGPNGVLSTSNTSYQPAYPAGDGWDFATGIGTINAYNLATHWPGSRLASSKSKQ